MRAEFRLLPERIEDIRRQLGSTDRFETTFEVQVRDQNQVVIAEVSKVLHVRKKPPSALGGKA
jgi:hypothetical protein